MAQSKAIDRIAIMFGADERGVEGAKDALWRVSVAGLCVNSARMVEADVRRIIRRKEIAQKWSVRSAQASRPPFVGCILTQRHWIVASDSFFVRVGSRL
jgi:hypothetical protein